MAIAIKIQDHVKHNKHIVPSIGRHRRHHLLLSIIMVFIIAVSYLQSSHSYMLPQRPSQLSRHCNFGKGNTSAPGKVYSSSSSSLSSTSNPTDGERSGTSKRPSSKRTDGKDSNPKKEKTLYEVLGAQPTDTRADLKKRYAVMAKLSHPDAKNQYKRNGRDENDDDEAVVEIDFQDVAEAWRILGDSKLRKRYDRELQAKAWSEMAQKYTNERLEKAVPVALDMMDKVAVPFLRRTTATTFAVGQAIATGVSGLSGNNNKNRNRNGRDGKINSRDQNATNRADKNGSSSLDPNQQQQQQQQHSTSESVTDAIMSAVEAGQQAGRIIDSIELNEKSEDLEERASDEKERAEKIAQELNALKEQRLLSTLASPNIPLSSDEAKQVLEILDVEDTTSVSIVDRAINTVRNTIEKEIDSLRETEQLFNEKLEVYEATDKVWNQKLLEQEAAKEILARKKSIEIEARKSLDKSQNDVMKAKEELVQTSNDLRAVEQQVRKSATEMDRITTQLSRKQERVRNALRKKTEIMKGGVQVQYLSEDELTSLRRREIQLMGESREIVNMVARLQSRSEKLKSRADALERWQQWDNK